jgi:hypothetical protein
MRAPSIARILGAVFLLAGIAGFVPLLTVPADLTAPYVTIGANYGFVAGLFPVNLVHDIVHLAFGVWGVAASFAAFGASVRYCRFVTWIYALMLLLGLMPITNTLFGIAPVYGHDLWLHAIIVLAAVFGGYGAASIPPPIDMAPLEAG